MFEVLRKSIYCFRSFTQYGRSFGNLMFLVHSNELSRMSFGVSGNLILKKVRSKGDRVI